MNELIDGKYLKKSYLDYGLKCINTPINGISINKLNKLIIHVEFSAFGVKFEGGMPCPLIPLEPKNAETTRYN